MDSNWDAAVLNPAQCNEPVRERRSLLLAGLRELPLPLRCAHVLAWGRNDLVAALQAVRADGAPIPPGFDAERLAWAVAFNIQGEQASVLDDRPLRQGIQGYCDRWAPDTSWEVIWNALVRPLGRAAPGSTLLSELSLSVACEQRDEWQFPGARPIGPAWADRAFEFVYGRNRPKVSGNVISSFGHRAGNAQSIADEAWSSVFCDYWSCKARRRFLGICRISTLVCQVARYIALDALRERGPCPSSEEIRDADYRRISQLPGDLGVTADPSEHLTAAELKRRIEECMSRFPAKQRIVAEMVWLHGIRAQNAAEILHVSEPAISQHLRKARDSMRECLRGHGFSVPE
jgi:RNA polymerase sigma factor (sigma-70 family)